VNKNTQNAQHKVHNAH